MSTVQIGADELAALRAKAEALAQLEALAERTGEERFIEITADDEYGTYKILLIDAADDEVLLRGTGPSIAAALAASRGGREAG